MSANQGQVRENGECPFCGSRKASTRDKWAGTGQYRKRVAYTRCHECGARGPVIYTEEEYDVRNAGPSKMVEDAIHKGAWLAWCGLGRTWERQGAADDRQLTLNLEEDHGE